ncbi:MULTISPECIES: sensor histidine kinase [Mesonia]|uniref:Signal transduction histidine-protein kinase BarA n=1 Tax=Mesonia oceanica TaxID=2687242 RepID=A0AC61Y6I1_9FLAO|nr:MULTISPECIES: HAMP domain-containing sensor histidine kinase [Mesonia]MAN26072.1 PAS domain-containing sensor histidine kinase [Mesonia sp.]MAQ42205.1 PAS domain-containing sensor histidine kinase [Mesonia sp.]MBJ97927.1 PAS domain-containing sensor histidine kinase [Flavobacteriaceae bacterium]VVV00094.1 Signal transduction histidine-protein kinase BarA [Mesonia oceanica]|tara:strand:- start:19775 stop:21007 length:1233 start_codon:yes stop_codon:yes gene_type:complete
MKKFEEINKSSFGILFESVSEGIIVVNKSQVVVAINASANKMFGYEEGELKGKPLDLLIPQKYRHNHDKNVDRFMESSENRQMGHGRDLYGLRKDGSQFPVEAGLNPFTLDGHHYVMAMVIDISIRKTQEKQILDLNTKLEQKIERRTEELKNTVIELEDEIIKRKEAENKIKESLRKERELNDLKTKFLSLVSHEFKTPLSGILTSTTLIGKYTQTEQQEKREKHLKTIKNKVKYLNNILDDFLSVERLETGKVNYKFSSFPLSKVTNEVIYDANMLLKDGQKISYPKNIDEIILDFDEKILELILTNLINNAIKYSPENTTISIEAFTQENMLSIIVKDQGIGIPEKEQKYIFKRYFRAENALLNQGTGIGLNIIQSHLENLGGNIIFTSKENEGSTFTVTLPLTSNQ